jgi:integrase
VTRQTRAKTASLLVVWTPVEAVAWRGIGWIGGDGPDARTQESSPRVDPDPAGTPLTFDEMARAYLEDYQLQRYRTMNTARPRVEHLREVFGGWPAEHITADAVRQYQLHRRQHGAEAATINRETSALSRMFQIAIRRGVLERMPLFPRRLEENPPRDGFFEHAEYLKVRAHAPAPYQDVLDFAYYSGWRRNEILHLTWEDVDLAGGVIRLSPRRSKTRTGRVLPISTPLRTVLECRQQRRQPGDPHVFQRDGVPVRVWRTALRDACRKAKVPHRMLHDCRRTAARNLIRAGVPERVAMLLTGHKTRAVFDRYNIVNEQELRLAGERLAAYMAEGDARARRATGS